ncbi:exodeoxyribonuclease V subunit gamma [Shewanella algae]
MFTLIQSNKMELLSATLADRLRDGVPGMSPLSCEQILVQSPGMSTWLRLELARHNGVAAAQEFPLPSSFIWQLCYLLLDDVPKENPFTKAAMTWKLMALLPSLLDRDNFAPLRHYLGDDVELKLFQLSGRIADIFDQYLVYRPEWILGWEQNESPLEIAPQHAWQPELWRELVRYNNQELQQSHYHRANLHQALIETLTGGSDHALEDLPPRLFVFGISSMAPQTLDVLYALASRIEVVMLSLSPCRHYWGDIIEPRARARMALAFEGKKQLPELWEDKLEVGNPILANNGRLGRELLDMVLELPPERLELEELFHPGNTDTLLGGIQNDILEMETLGEPLGPDVSKYLNIARRRPLAATDDSITLRSCHSPLREVETLHDHLLHRLRSDPSLAAKDIMVMLPDVAAYAPYIDAVFSAKSGDHFIPYAIADRGAAQESPLIAGFLNLLALDKSRFGLTDIISILEVPAVLARFGIAQEELEQLKGWLKAAGIRWGRDSHNREELGLPGFDKHSWAFGIRRMLLGYALGDDAELYQGDLPLAGIEGQSAQALGKLLNFIEALDDFREELKQQTPPEERVAQLNALLDAFYLAQEDDAREEINDIRQAIDRFAEELRLSGFSGVLPLTVVWQWFNSTLSESRVGQRYLAGSVNFCTLMPMRSIPFRQVCLLGMNDGVYPRVQHPVGFDLTAHEKPRRGDRSRRLDDRYLFLEALLSARDQLYISYIGHSERDNSERIPSMLVSELLEYIQLCYRPDEAQFTPPAVLTDADEIAALGDLAADALMQHLIIQQPLQPFDARLYSDSELPGSFATQWCPREMFAAQSPAPFIEHELGEETALKEPELELSALIRFFRNPAQYFCQRVLQLDLRLDIDSQDNDEPFELNALQRYQLQLLMMQDALEDERGELDETLLDKLKAEGLLPMAPFDDLLLDQYRRDIAPAVERTRFLRAELPKPDAIEIALKLEVNGRELLLCGRIEDCYPKGLVNLRPGTTKPKDLLSLYIRHLCLNASGIHRHSYLLDAGHFHAMAPLKAESAKALLGQLAALFELGQHRPLPFMAQTSMAYFSAEVEDGLPIDTEHQLRLAEAESAWLDDAGFGDGQDPHNARLFRFPEDFGLTLDDSAYAGTATDFGRKACEPKLNENEMSEDELSENEFTLSNMSAGLPGGWRLRLKQSLSFPGLAQGILAPLISLYHKDKLAALADFTQMGQE